MKREEKLKLLEAWKSAWYDWNTEYTQFTRLTGATIDRCALLNSGWKMFEAYTKATSALVGDDAGWLSWFYLENEMGSKGLRAGIAGQPQRIWTLLDLLSLIEGEV